MRLSSLRYLFLQGLSSLWKNRMMTLASVGILTACLLIVGFAILLTENINAVVGFVESQNEIVAFMYKTGDEPQFTEKSDDVVKANQEVALQIQADFRASNLTEEQFRSDLLQTNMTSEDLTLLFGKQSIADFVPPEQKDKPKAGYPVVYWSRLIAETESALNQVENVSSVRFVSKEEGLYALKNAAFEKELSSLLDGYVGEENPLSHSFVITIEDLALLEPAVAALEEVPGIRFVKASTSVASSLVALRRIVNLIGWSIVLALCVVSLVIIMNTIRASIFTRRKEINIMKYVGATNTFIRVPFLIEGFFLGLLATAISYGLVFVAYSLAYHYFSPSATSWITQVFAQMIPFDVIAVKLALFFVVSGIGLGVLGSVLSMKNYIKV